MGNFQTQVNTQPAIGVAGDFASHNPRFSVLAGPGGLVAGPLGAVVGRFCWTAPPADLDGTNQLVNNYGAGPVTGFLYRKQQGLITVYLQDASLLVPQGFPLALASGGDFLVTNTGSGQAIVGNKAYANLQTGAVTFAATGNPTAGGVSTSWSIAAETNSFVGSISGNQLTVTGSVVGTIYPGTTLSGTNVASGTLITNQISGTTGGIGVYEVSIPEQSVAAGTAISGTYGLLTLTTVSSGSFAVGDSLTGATTGVSAGTTITQLLTGTGGSGSTAVVTPTQTSSSGTEGNLTAAGNVETKWIAMSTGLNGELVKISDHPLG